MIDPRTVILLGEELDQLRAEMTKQARLLGISAEKELALRAENEKLKKRCFPSKVLMIGDAGHYVSEAVFVEIERLKAELAEAKKDADSAAICLAADEPWEPAIRELKGTL